VLDAVLNQRPYTSHSFALRPINLLALRELHQRNSVSYGASRGIGSLRGGQGITPNSQAVQEDREVHRGHPLAGGGQGNVLL